MKEIQDLLEAYGFSVDFKDDSQNKIRFQNEETFIDVWDGKKGITIGVYNPETKMVRYERRVNAGMIEDLIANK
jgi:hypothetical protein